MEIVGVPLKVRRPGVGEDKSAATFSPRFDQDGSKISPLCDNSQHNHMQRSQTTLSRAMLQPAKAMSPKKGMIRLTALQGELLRPHDYFPQSHLQGTLSANPSFHPHINTQRRVCRPAPSYPQSTQPHDASSPLEDNYSRDDSAGDDTKRVAGTFYLPESLKFFGKQLTMVDLTNTVDSVLQRHTSRKMEHRQDHLPQLPDVHKFDRELTLLAVASIRNSVNMKPSRTPSPKKERQRQLQLPPSNRTKAHS